MKLSRLIDRFGRKTRNPYEYGTLEGGEQVIPLHLSSEDLAIHISAQMEAEQQNPEKEKLIETLHRYIEVLEDDNVRVESFRIGQIPQYDEAEPGTPPEDYTHAGDNFDIDFDVVYLDKINRD